jgi:uncharacterized membrane protein YfcA
MSAGPLRDLLTLLAGVATGVMSGIFGVGGAVLSTPAIRALGCSAALAVGTTLPSIFPGAVAGFLRYRHQDIIDWAVVRAAVPAGMVGSVVGAQIAHLLPGDGHPLMILTAVLLVVSAVSLIRQREARPGDPVAPPRTRPGLRAGGAGSAAGLMSGLLGIGGGVIMVPLFRAQLGLPMRRAIATSLTCVGLLALPGTLIHSLNGAIDWRFALWLSIGVVPGARLGAGIAMRTGERRLRLVFGWFLLLIAVYYGLREGLELLG